MSHNQAQNILEYLKDKNNLQAIQIRTTSKEFNLRFNSSVSMFFRSLKNGLYSFQGTSNRVYFKGLSGVYFSECNGEQLEIIILYDTSNSILNKIQVITRLRKLLGFDILIDFGTFEQFEGRIRQMAGVIRKTQTFGNWYKHL
jgi:hypothetical protein